MNNVLVVLHTMLFVSSELISSAIELTVVAERAEVAECVHRLDQPELTTASYPSMPVASQRCLHSLLEALRKGF